MTQLAAMLRQIIPLYEHMEIAVELPGDGVFRVNVPLKDDMGSHVGTMHPAFQWAAAELLGGLVALDAFPSLDEIFLVVRGVNIQFVRPARTGVVAECTFPPRKTEELRAAVAAGEGTFDLEMTVKDESGETVATATGDYLVRKRRKPS